MKHRGDARKRVARVALEGPAPAPGSPVLDGDLPVGTLGSAASGQALALLRLDRVEEAELAGRPLTSNGARVSLLR
jgi:folate-binding Fe-S cluster repair protein YgfZ